MNQRHVREITVAINELRTRLMKGELVYRWKTSGCNTDKQPCPLPKPVYVNSVVSKRNYCTYLPFCISSILFQRWDDTLYCLVQAYLNRLRNPQSLDKVFVVSDQHRLGIGIVCRSMEKVMHYLF